MQLNVDATIEDELSMIQCRCSCTSGMAGPMCCGIQLLTDRISLLNGAIDTSKLQPKITSRSRQGHIKVKQFKYISRSNPYRICTRFKVKLLREINESQCEIEMENILISRDKRLNSSKKRHASQDVWIYPQFKVKHNRCNLR